MFRKSLIFLLALTAMWWSSVQVQAQSSNSEANRLFVEANSIFISSKNLPTSDREQALARVRSLLDQITSEYPESKPARAITSGNAGAIVISDLPTSNDASQLPPTGNPLALASSKLDKLEGASALTKLEHAIEILDILLLSKDLEEAKLLADQILALPKWESVLTPKTAKEVRQTASNADVSSKTAFVCLVGTPVLDATIDQYVEPFIRAKLNSGFSSYLVSFLHETVDGACAAGPALIVGSASTWGLLYPIAKGVEVLRELDSLNKANTDLVNQAIDFAKLQIAALESVPTYDFQDLLDYKVSQDAVATDLMTGSGLNVGAGRRLLIVNAMMLIKAKQIEGRDVYTELETLGRQVSEFDETPENLWYQWAKTVNFGRDGLRDYAGFAADVFEKLEILREAVDVGEADTPTGENGSRWGPSIVPSNGVELGYRPCGSRTDIRRCLEEKGLGKEAIDFSFAVAGDLIGEVFAIDFHEVGEIDVAHIEFNGTSPHQMPVLLNGSLGELALETTNNLAATFTDPTSQKMLQRFPRAISRAAHIRSHRLLQDQTQRFVLVETIIDGCRACPILGSAVSFLEVEPETGGALRRTPIGLSLEDPGDSVDLSEQVLRERSNSLQTMLNILGYNAGEMDGYPGPQTRNALMAFQAERCLPTTGQPDSATTSAMMATSGFDAECSGQRLPSGLSANAPLASGKYVTDLEQCKLEQTPWDLLWEQVLVDGTSFMLGHENPCTTRRTDIRDGITLFRGKCTWADSTREASWRLDVRSNTEFAFVSQQDTFGNLEAATYRLCEAADVAQVEESYFEPERGTEVRKSILNAVRPIAERHFGPPIEFMVDTMRVLENQAYVELSAQRPGGSQIELAATPAAKRGEVDFGVGNANVVSGFLIEQAGEWKPRDIVIQATEAWWVGDCTGLKKLMPETCGQIDIATRPVQSAEEETASTSATPPICEAEWVTTSNGCKACVERPEGWLRYMQKTANLSTRWSGACKEGLIDGQGVLSWYSGQDEGWRTIMNSRYPAISGVPAFEIRPGDVTVRYAANFADGEVGYDRRCVAIKSSVFEVSPILVIVNADIPLANPEIHRLVMEEAERMVLADCEKERNRVGIRKEVSRFQVYSINFALSNHPRVKPFHDTGRPIMGGDLYRVLTSCGFRPRISEISECFWENPATDKIRQQVAATNRSRADAIRRAERLREEQAKQAEQTRKQARIAAIQKSVEQRWASHMDDMFSGRRVISNVGDLLQYDKARAISLLSQGVTLKLETANMSFRDGTVIIAQKHDPTDVLKPVRDAARAEMDTWEQWFDTTANVGRDYSGPSINVICRLDASVLEHLDGKSTALFTATMQSLDSRSASFNCELK